MAALREMDCERLVVGWRRVGAVAGVLGALVLCGSPALAHDDVHGRPHFKGVRANPTAVMRAFQGDRQGAQALTALSGTACAGGAAGEYPCENIDLLGFLPLSEIGGGGPLVSANDVWGWTDPASGREFALVGRNDGTAFVEITDPLDPVYLGILPTHTTASSWRDIKVYADHAFVVSEASEHGMQVFDLTRLLASPPSPPQTFTEDAQYNGFGNAHNLVINEDSGYAYAVGTTTCGGGLHIVDIGNPTVPTAVGCFSGDGYTHDAQCVIYHGPDGEHAGKEICFAANEDSLTIVDVSAKQSPLQVSRTGYAGRGYTHQGWLDEEHRLLFLDDELDEQQQGHNTLTRVWDVSDLDAPIVIDTFTHTTPAIDHNLYVKGDRVFQANYRAGLRVLQIVRDAGGNYLRLEQAGFFDIYPTSDSANFNGAWSTYPYFPSGSIVVSGIEQGLFVVTLAGECGNGLREGAEICDGADLGGETCVSQGCSSGGTLACNVACTGFDVSGCSGCPVCDNDGACEPGEECDSCSADCIGGITSGAACGNGSCEAGDAENCASCPADCRGVQTGKPSNRYCCGDGGGQNALPCSDPVCNASGWSCTDVPSSGGEEFCCGDLVCTGEESLSNCALDCDICGNGTCDDDEDSCRCPTDCGSPPAAESSCTDGTDEDCDTLSDCEDPDCSADLACQGCALASLGDPCQVDADCCSSKCRGPAGRKTCK